MKLTKFWKRNRYTFGSRGGGAGGGSRGGASSRTNTGNSAPLCQILKYVQGFDYLWMLVGLFGAIVASMTWPALTVAYGETVNEFAEYEKWLNANRQNQTEWDREQKRQDFMHRVYIIAGSTAIVCITNIIGNFLSLYSFQMFSLRLTKTVKRLYFQAILRQEISWFDMQNSGEFASRITSDFKKFENAFNENLSLLSYNISSAIIHLGLAFVYGWKLTLIVLSIAPLMGIAAFITTKLQAYYTQKELKACSMASSVAEEAISAIRTVFAFNGQRKEANRYESQLKPAMIYGFKRNFFSGVGVAIHWTLIYCALALGIWFGVQLHVNNEPGYDVGSVTIIFWAVTSTGFSIGYSAPFYEAFQTGKTAAKSIFDVIERVSSIDSSKHFVGTCPDNYQAIIEFQNVHFAYPSRRDVKVLRGLNLRINSGERIALVGPSGCGKSTTIQLIQRFYDVDRGKVLLDGQDIRYLNVGWLRQQLGVVGQEPVLFDASIEENIRLGMPFDQMDQITLADVERAAVQANAHEFIKKLPLGYQTHVGDRGTQLSGGQKQRIAIARALIGKPKILLLDEATSALDLASEQTVQTALDRASRNCTTVIIAHRLSTIINADRIIYIDQGEVVEQGTHDALMAQRGRYYDLVQAQLVNNNSDETTREMTSEHEQIAQQLSDFTPIRTGSSGFRSFTSDISNVGSKLHPVVVTDDGIEPEQWKELEQFPLKRLWRLVWMDKTYFLIAFITALIYGLSTPIYALIFGEFVNIFVEDNNRDRIISRTLIITISYLALAVGILICCTTQIALFGIVGEKLTKRLRTMAYRAILRQNIPYFDDKSNSAGALCSRLSNDAANVQGATGLRVSMMCQAVSTVVFSIIMGLICNWRLLLVSMALMPLVAFASVISSSIYSNQAKKDSKTAEKASKTTIEVMNSIRTVVSLNKEEYFYLKLERYLLEHYLSTRMKCLMKSIMISISFGAPLFAYTVAFAYGGYLIGWGLLGTGNFFKIVESIIFGAVVVGQSAVLSADFAKAKLAATNIFKLIDNSPPGSFDDDDDQDAINNNNAHNNAHKDNGKMVGCRLEMNASKRKDRSAGDIAFRGVHFSYPSRPGSKVLNGLSFSAQRGQTVALVGASGCGKSTSIQLLERFYECNDGQVYLDENNIARVPVEWLRSQMSLVQQEPILFSYSIKENIAYGDNTRPVTDEQIQTAAVMANAHEFIAQLPKGYDTPVGAKGVCKLSGGQKQRIAIARALIRDPPILLLDEATSALDTESEQIVQRALDEASKNRTCLVIAHRLNTIVNSDKIVVIDRGQNVEEGTHHELLSRRGHYWRLYKNATEPQPNQ